MAMITSSTNPKITYVRDLIRKKKDRLVEHVFAAEGVRLVEEAVKHHVTPVLVLFSEELSSRGQETLHQFEKNNAPIFQVADHLLAKISDTKTSQGIAAIFPMALKTFPEHPDFLLIIDQVRDPGNMGTLLRTARAVGVEGVFILDGSADVYSPKVVRAGMGAHFSLSLQTGSSSDLEQLLSGKNAQVHPKLFSTVVSGGRSMWECDFRQPCAIVIGGEANGVSDEVLELTDQKITIQMVNETESLNAGIAGSVALYEVARQRAQA